MHATEEPSDERDPAATRTIGEEVDVEQVEGLRSLKEHAIGVAAREAARQRHLQRCGIHDGEE